MNFTRALILSALASAACASSSLAQELYTRLEVVQSGTTFSYTLLYDDDPCRWCEECCGDDFVNGFQIQLEAEVSVIASPPGWVYDTDGHTFVAWRCVDAIAPYPHDLPVFGFLGGFVIQASVTTTAEVGYSVSSWNHLYEEAGPTGTGPTLAPFQPVEAAIWDSCVADVDDGTGTGTLDEGVTIDDLLYYLGIFERGSLAADVDDGSGTGTLDGGVTIDDLLYYLARFEAGC